MKLRDKNILVTGGTGFAGSHLVEALIPESSRVYVADIVMDPRSYFFKAALDQKTTVLDLDVNDFDALFDVVTKFKINAIFHLAAQPVVEVAYYNPRRTLITNVVGTINILESARLSNEVQAIIFASSDKAYGKLKDGEYRETDALRGDHPYDVSKSAADLIAQSYFNTYGLPIVITRFGNIYGEGDLNSSRIIPSIIKAIIDENTLALRSDGTHVRDYLYVKDVASGYLALAKNIDKTRGQAFNFGSSDTYNIKELIKLIEKSIGRKIPYKIVNDAINELPYQSLNYTKVRKMIGWEPKHTIVSTIDRIISYDRDNQ